MDPTTCLADIDGDTVALFRRVLEVADAPSLANVADIDVAAIGRLAPSLLICDVDFLKIDPLEILRQLRFAMPDCIIVVYTRTLARSWGLQCHLAGANGVLSKTSTIVELALGLRAALSGGCFTDPRLEAA